MTAVAVVLSQQPVCSAVELPDAVRTKAAELGAKPLLTDKLRSKADFLALPANS